MAFSKLKRETQPPFDESYKGSLKQPLYQGAEKKNYEEYQDSILENKKSEKETNFESWTEWIQSNQWYRVFLCHCRQATHTHQWQAVLGLASQSNSSNTLNVIWLMIHTRK